MGKSTDSFEKYIFPIIYKGNILGKYNKMLCIPSI